MISLNNLTNIGDDRNFWKKKKTFYKLQVLSLLLFSIYFINYLIKITKQIVNFWDKIFTMRFVKFIQKEKISYCSKNLYVAAKFHKNCNLYHRS